MLLSHLATLLLVKTVSIAQHPECGVLQVEYLIAEPKMVQVATATNMPHPLLTVAAINIKAIAGSDKTNEVVAVSIVYAHNVRMDIQTDTARWQQCKGVHHFSVLRKLDATSWPLGLQAMVKVRVSLHSWLFSITFWAASHVGQHHMLGIQASVQREYERDPHGPAPKTFPAFLCLLTQCLHFTL
jgi:hypothetical protein